jgi:hypothetical protein
MWPGLDFYWKYSLMWMKRNLVMGEKLPIVDEMQPKEVNEM